MAYKPLNNQTETNSVTEVSVVPAPPSGAGHIIPPGGINIYNKDTVAATVSIVFNSGATKRIMLKATLIAGATLNNVGPIHLTGTTDTIGVVLDGAVATNQLPVVVSYYLLA